jgi:hypothetical protein
MALFAGCGRPKRIQVFAVEMRSKFDFADKQPRHGGRHLHQSGSDSQSIGGSNDYESFEVTRLHAITL